MSGINILGSPGTGPNAPLGFLNFPAALLPIFQENMLDRKFQDFLQSILAYRECADHMDVPASIGQTLTATRPGLLQPSTLPLGPGTYSSNNPLGGDTTGGEFDVEQYTIAVNEYTICKPGTNIPQPVVLNILQARAAIANMFMQNVRVIGIHAPQTLERLARDAMYSVYFGGNTFVTTTLGAASTSVHVDNINGFGYAFNTATGKWSSVSGTNTVLVKVGSNWYTLTGVAPDATNSTSLVFNTGATSMNGVSGTLTFTTAVSVADGTSGNRVTFQFAPTIIRAGGATSTASLTSADILKVQHIIDAVAQLKSNAVPEIDSGGYVCYLAPNSMAELFEDPALQTLFMGQNASEEFRKARLYQEYGVRFKQTTESPIQTNVNGVTVYRPLVCGKGAVLEGRFEGMDDYVQTLNGMGQGVGDVRIVDGIALVTRKPIDVLQQVITQTWFWAGGFCVPTDITATQNIIPTASSSYWKRAVVIEHA